MTWVPRAAWRQDMCREGYCYGLYLNSFLIPYEYITGRSFQLHCEQGLQSNDQRKGKGMDTADERHP